jgi:hypothetical protein
LSGKPEIGGFLSRKKRTVLLILAGLLALAGLWLLLAAIFSPGEILRLQATLAPTLLIPPQAVMP